MACSPGRHRAGRGTARTHLRARQARHRDGQHLGDEHGREEGQQSREAGGPQAQRLGGGHRREHEGQLVGEPGDQHVGRGAGVLAQPVEPRWTAPTKRRQPSLVAKRPPRRVLAAAASTPTSSSSVATARARATRVAVPRWRSPGLTGEAGDGDDRQDEPAGEPLEHHRGERARRLARCRATGG